MVQSHGGLYRLVVLRLRASRNPCTRMLAGGALFGLLTHFFSLASRYCTTSCITSQKFDAQRQAQASLSTSACRDLYKKFWAIDLPAPHVVRDRMASKILETRA